MPESLFEELDETQKHIVQLGDNKEIRVEGKGTVALRTSLLLNESKSKNNAKEKLLLFSSFRKDLKETFIQAYTDSEKKPNMHL